jgi:hypothetical protein
MPERSQHRPAQLNSLEDGMDKETKETCWNCDGDGWAYDNMGGCGGPYKVKCLQCKNDWSADSDDDDSAT